MKKKLINNSNLYAFRILNPLVHKAIQEDVKRLSGARSGNDVCRMWVEDHYDERQRRYEQPVEGNSETNAEGKSETKKVSPSAESLGVVRDMVQAELGPMCVQITRLGKAIEIEREENQKLREEIRELTKRIEPKHPNLRALK